MGHCLSLSRSLYGRYRLAPKTEQDRSRRIRTVTVTIIATFACIFLSALPAAAETDIVHFGEKIRVQEGETVKDVVCFLCSVDVEGEVQGDIVVFGGNLHLKGSANGDVVVFAGSVNMSEDATVNHDLVVFGGTLKSATNSSVHGSHVIFPIFIFLPIILAFIAIFAVIYALIRLIFFRNRPAYPPRP